MKHSEYVELKHKGLIAMYGACSCSKCHSTKRIELHHIGVKRANATTILIRLGYDEFLRELGQCIILCHDCHAIETEKQRKERRGK